MVLDGGVTLGFIIGGGLLSGVNAIINIYRWITTPSQTVHPHLGYEKLDDDTYSFTIFADRSMETFKKLIINYDMDYGSDDDSTFTDNKNVNVNTNNFKQFDVISFNERIPPRTGESTIKRFRVEHHLFPSNVFNHDDIFIKPLRNNACINGLQIYSKSKTSLDKYMKNYILTSDQITFEA